MKEFHKASRTTSSIIRVVCFFLLPITLAVAQSDDIALLDGLESVRGLKKTGSLRSFTASNLYGHINGGAELFLEFGFEELSVQHYATNGGTITLEVYRMSDELAAMGIFLMKRGIPTPDSSLSLNHTLNEYQILFQKNQYLVMITRERKDIPTRALIEMTKSIASKIPEGTLQDHFISLPKDKMIPHSTRIFRGPLALESIYTFSEKNIFGLGENAYAVSAEYESSADAPVRKIVICYPDENAAVSSFAFIENQIDEGISIARNADGSFLFVDRQKNTGVIRRMKSSIHIDLILR